MEGGTRRDTGVLYARPAAAGRARFVPGRKDKVLAFVSYALAYMLTAFAWYGPEKTAVLYPAAGAVFTAWVLAAFPQSGRAKEHVLWLSGMWAAILCGMSRAGALPFTLGHIWEGSGLPFAVFLPLFCGHWVLACSGKAAGGKCGVRAVRDAVRIYAAVPCANALAQLDTVCAVFRGMGRKDGKKSRVPVALAVCGVSSVFFAVALALLCSADSGFDAIVARIAGALWSGIENWAVDGFMIRLSVSVPLGAYMFAQTAGISRKEMSSIREADARSDAAAQKLRKGPVGVWLAVLGCFIALYASFLCVQGAELLTAYRANWAPGSLTMAQFAKQGFFEMCAVMALNFALLYTAEKTAAASLRGTKAGRVLFTLVLACSILFALSAVVKLAMYLRSFGYTPLRLRGAWAIAALTAGCACALVSVWKGKSTMRAWVLFTASTLVLTLLA